VHAAAVRCDQEGNSEQLRTIANKWWVVMRTSQLKKLVVSPSEAMFLLDCGRTRLNELINAKELESYKDGYSRKITLESIEARVERLRRAEQAA
jgi:hypothetical protein